MSKQAGGHAIGVFGNYGEVAGPGAPATRAGFGWRGRERSSFFFESTAGMVPGKVSVSATAETGKSTASMQTPQPAQNDFIINFLPNEGCSGTGEKVGHEEENA